ncbi:MAG: heme-binding domain-containing protein [Acidimicrobiia bacterium]
MWRAIRWLAIGVVALALGIQLIPYGHDHQNPPVIAEPAWDSQQTLDLAKRACFDCHSNETKWAWYSNIAPMSWLIQHDIEEGRQKLNWSEWDNPPRENESVETIREGSMPPRVYTVIHSEARLTDQEMSTLIDGMRATFGPGGD